MRLPSWWKRTCVCGARFPVRDGVPGLFMRPVEHCSTRCLRDAWVLDLLSRDRVTADEIPAHIRERLHAQGKLPTPRLLCVLHAGLEWLYDTPQPDDAIMQHHGIVAPAAENRRLSFTPTGVAGRPVIVLDVAQPTRDTRGELANGLTAGEIPALVDALTELGHQVAATWNGKPGLVTGSVSLSHPAHPSLVAAVRRYRDGCPTHRTVFCGSPFGNVPPCSWYRDGNARLIRPTWPDPPPDSTSEGDTTP